MITGRARASGSATPIPSAIVVALRAEDYQFAAAAQADPSGAYRLDLPAGGYKVGVLDPEGRHTMGWFVQQPYSGLADAATVVAPGTAEVSLTPTTGSVAGSVVDDPNGSAVACAWVVVIGSTGRVAGVGVADAQGDYTVPGLPVGTYRATMVDPATGRIQEYWNDSLSYMGATPFSVAPGATTTVEGALALPAPFGHPTQWVAKQFTEILGRAPSGAEWATWTAFYAAQPACTAAALTALPRYLAGVAPPTTPGLPTSPSTEFAGLYPATTAIDRATRAAAVSRAALSHDPNDNDWTAFIKPYVQGTATWASTVNGIYNFAMAFVGPAVYCNLTDPGTGFGLSRPIDLRAKVMALLPTTTPALAPSRTQGQLAQELQAAANGSTLAQRTVTLGVGEVVRVGGSANANQQLVVPPGVTLTSEGAPAYSEPAGATPSGLAYARMGRIVSSTSSSAFPVADGLICAASVCNNVAIVKLSSGSHLDGVWVDGQGVSDANYKVANVETTGSAAPTASTPYDDGTSVVASRLSEPSRDGAAIRAYGASTGPACVNERIVGNLVTGYSSRHQFDRRGQAQWVDGIRVLCEDAEVAHNSVVDVTDLGIVMDGSVGRAGVVNTQRSQVHDNLVLSAGQDAHVALGADAMGLCQSISVTTTSGSVLPGPIAPCLDQVQPRDFTGARIHDNEFFSGSRTSFDVGLLVGGGALWGDHQILNQAPDGSHPGAKGVSVTDNTTGGVTTRVNIGIDVHDMTHATVRGNTGTFRLVDGNPRITWNKCPQGQRLAGAAELDTLDADVSFAADEGPRGCVIGEPPPEGIENLRINDAGTGFVGTATGSDFRVWGGDLDSLGATHIAEMVDNFRDVRRMGANVIRLLIDTEDVVVQPTCTGCPVGVDQAAVDNIGDVATAAEEVGLYLDITGVGIAFHHHNRSWFDELGASPADEALRWEVQETFWEALSTELRDKTSIAWYDLTNEPTLPAGPDPVWCFDTDLAANEPCWVQNLVRTMTDPADPARQRTGVEVGTAWMTRMRDAIKVGGGDTVHPVSIGQLSFCAGGLVQASRATLDFDMVHRYPTDATVAADITITNNCKQPGRPLVVEETFFTASFENLERFFDSTQGRTAGYLGHYIGGTPSQLAAWLDANPTDPSFWARIFWFVWDQFAIRNLVARNPSGPGLMAT